MTEQTIPKESKQWLLVLLTGALLLFMGFMLGRVTADRYELTFVSPNEPGGMGGRYLLDKNTGDLYRPGQNGREWEKSVSFP